MLSGFGIGSIRGNSVEVGQNGASWMISVFHVLMLKSVRVSSIEFLQTREAD